MRNFEMRTFDRLNHGSTRHWRPTRATYRDIGSCDPIPWPLTLTHWPVVSPAKSIHVTEIKIEISVVRWSRVLTHDQCYTRCNTVSDPCCQLRHRDVAGSTAARDSSWKTSSTEWNSATTPPTYSQILETAMWVLRLSAALIRQRNSKNVTQTLAVNLISTVLKTFTFFQISV